MPTKGVRKHRANRRFAIACRRAPIDRFASTLTTFGSVIAATRPARPIVARCGCPGADGNQGRMGCATPAGRRAKNTAEPACEARPALTAA